MLRMKKDTTDVKIFWSVKKRLIVVSVKVKVKADTMIHTHTYKRYMSHEK